MGIGDKFMHAKTKARALLSHPDARKATDLLRAQHRMVEALFTKIEESDSLVEKRKLVNELARNLAGHMIIEQEIFYPACRADAKLKKVVLESFEEHEVASHELDRVLASRGANLFDAHVKVLKDLILHHAQEEEEVLFPRAERSFDSERLEALGTRMKPLFEQALKNPRAAHTRAVASAGAERSIGAGQHRRAAAKAPRRSSRTTTRRR